MKHIHELIYNAVETIPDRVEFDAKIIQEILEEHFDEEVSLQKIAQNLRKMNFVRRRLTNKERQKWRIQYGTQPKVLYKQHLGTNPDNYERGIAMVKPRPRLNDIQKRNEWIEECATCPEFDECQGNIKPCPRHPVQATAPKDRVMRLEDFE